MAHLQYFNGIGPGSIYSDQFYFSQAVLIPGTRTLKCSGQGGWDPETGILDSDNRDRQVENIFRNLEKVLVASGARGWDDVYLVKSFHLDLGKTVPEMADMLRKYCPKHRPVWTAVAAPAMVLPEMTLEVEVEAIIGSSGGDAQSG